MYRSWASSCRMIKMPKLNQIIFIKTNNQFNSNQSCASIKWKTKENLVWLKTKHKLWSLNLFVLPIVYHKQFDFTIIVVFLYKAKSISIYWWEKIGYFVQFVIKSDYFSFYYQSIKFLLFDKKELILISQNRIIEWL